jgi:hypothetical protein
MFRISLYCTSLRTQTKMRALMALAKETAALKRVVMAYDGSKTLFTTAPIPNTPVRT